MTSIKEQYQKTIVPALKKELGYSNIWQLPRILKVVINVGLGAAATKDQKYVDAAVSTLRKITGQHPVPTLSKQSISNFKIRQGQVVGLKVTLRGEKMYSFLEKFVHVTLPRIRDFRGLEQKSVDHGGNLTIGMKENIAFPEIAADEVERIHGVEVTVVTTAKDRKEGLALYRQLGIAFRTS